MLPFAIENATVSAVISAYRSGTLSCKELTETYLQRIRTYDPLLHSVITINPNATAEAEALDRYLKETGKLKGSLHGIPVMLKDNIGTADIPTTAGSMALKGFIPDEDAFITTRLKEAGAVILGKTNMHEFAIWGETISSVLGQTLNPYDYTRTPGGSSGGSSAAVAASLCLASIGTDTINSVRSPSASCSLVGIRPTTGVISRSGIIPYSMSQDTAGPIAKNVDDAVRILAVISGYDPDDPASVPDHTYHRDLLFTAHKESSLNGMRIGVLESFFGKEDRNTRVNVTVRSAIQKMAEDGAILIPVTDQIDSTELARTASVHLEEFNEDLNEYLAKYGKNAPYHTLQEIYDSGLTHPGVQESILTALSRGRNTPEYHEKIEKQKKLREKVLAIFRDYDLDVIVYPHQQQPVCKVGTAQKRRNGVLSSVTGFPSITVPAGYMPGSHAPVGIPAGLEMLARPYDENRLIGIAAAFEKINPVRIPPVLMTNEE